VDIHGKDYFVVPRSRAVSMQHPKPVGLLWAIDQVKIAVIAVLFPVVFRDSRNFLPSLAQV
jgi:hypothetical protein